MVEIGVKLFAAAREAVGRDSLALELPAGSRASDVLDRLERDYPALAALRPGLTLAVNLERAAASRLLAAGDEVALIPPVGGG